MHPLKSILTTISVTGMIYTSPAVISHDCEEDASIKYSDIYRNPRKPVGIKSRLSIRNENTNYRHHPSIRNDYSQSNSHYRAFNTHRVCERHINHTSNDKLVFDTDLYSNMNDISQMHKHNDMNNKGHRYMHIDELNFNMLQEWSSRDIVMPSSRTGRDTNNTSSCQKGPKMVNIGYQVKKTEFDRRLDPSKMKKIPCLFIEPHLGSDSLLIYFHANGEDISFCAKICRLLSSALNVGI